MTLHKTSSHAVYSLKLHIVLVTKYRRKALTEPLLAYLHSAFGEILEAWRCELLEFGGEEDHVHLLVDVHPALNISTLINNLKTASARRARNRFSEHLRKIFWKPVLWHRAYFVASAGGAPLEAIKAYVQSQGTDKTRRSDYRV